MGIPRMFAPSRTSFLLSLNTNCSGYLGWAWRLQRLHIPAPAGTLCFTPLAPPGRRRADASMGAILSHLTGLSPRMPPLQAIHLTPACRVPRADYPSPAVCTAMILYHI